MNIYEKITEVRMAILKKGITKDAKGYSYKYIDLPQIESIITEECAKVRLLTVVDFANNIASIRVFDLDIADDSLMLRGDIPALVISVPCDYSLVDIKGSQPIQKVGGMMTYMRRYLYMQLFAISEHDAVEGIGKASQEVEDDMAVDPIEEQRNIDPKVKALADKFSKEFPDYIPSLVAWVQRKMPEVKDLYDMELNFLQNAYDKQVAKKKAIEGAKA